MRPLEGRFSWWCATSAAGGPAAWTGPPSERRASTPSASPRTRKDRPGSRFRWRLLAALADELGRDVSGVLVVHAGGGAGLFSALLPGWVGGAEGSQPVTRSIGPAG